MSAIPIPACSGKIHRRLTAWIVGGTLLLSSAAQALTCATPGKDGVGTGITGVVNTYYPGTASALAGATSISLGTSRGASAQITVGDLLLVMQMQDATLNTSNTTAYGSGAATASGATAINAGKFEYVVATSASNGGGTVTVRGDGASGGLINSYANSAYTATSGAKRFQVIRVPQYSSATLGAALVPSAWDGASGGVLAINVAGTLNLNGGTMNASGLGFRGGGGRSLTGSAGTTGTDYVNLASNNAHGQKGEGIAGSPRFLNDAGTLLDTALEGYPGGSSARGAPGNAGGGGTDANPAANDQNSGGGGGAGGGMGGKGGNAWSSASTVGGVGGTPAPFGASQLLLGGGGGAGTTNNATGTPANGFASSGAAGGGAVLIRAGTVAGTGTITADGASANNSVLNDGSGGGGAGGSILVVSPNALPATLSVKASGGTGGTNTGGGAAHGPGGGGGGGAVVLSGSGPSVTVTGGIAGTTAVSGNFGAVGGSIGSAVTTATVAAIPGASSSPLCRPALNVTKTTSTPLRTKGNDTTATYTISLSNTGGGASGVGVSDPLPAPFAYTGTVVAPVYAGGATGPASVTGTGTTTVVFGTVGGTPANSFVLPQGGSVSLTFTVTLNAAPSATYQNPASVNFSDPARTGTQTVSPGGTYTDGATAGGSNYASASSTGEDVVINAPPTTANVTNGVLLNTAPAMVLTPNLSAVDTDGTVATYTIVTLPAAGSGVLNVNGAAATAGQTFTAAQLGTLSFAPAAGFNGSASFTYLATDNLGATSNTSAYTIPVNAAPVAVNDASSTPANTAKTFSITGNDTDVAPGTVNVASTVFATSGQPSGSALSNANRTIAVSGQGSYTLDNAGNVTFTPTSGYSGTTTAVKYTVTDDQGAVSNAANITVTVTPVATNDAATTAPSALVNIPVLTNDIGTGKVLTSLLFPVAGQPAGSAVSNGGKTLTNADGVYTIRTDGTVDFTPALGKTGTLSPVLYTFVDSAGQTSNPATITVTVSSIVPPTATNDSKATPKNTAVTLEGSTNDTPGSLAIDNTSVVLTAGGIISNAGKTLTNAQGVYQVQVNGTVIFTPVSTFAGVTTPVSYTVKDTAGTTSNAATLSVTVTNQPPVANTLTNTLVTSTSPAAALSPGISGTDPDGTVVIYTVTALPTAAQGTLYCTGTAIASVPSNCVPAQLSFKPNPAFNGSATFQYTVTDDNGATSPAAIYTIPVNKPPVAVNDSAATDPNVSVTFSVTGNDTDTAPGTVDVTTAVFDPSSNGTISNAGKTLTITGEGVYTLANTGTVTFAPAPGFNNGVSTARYTVKDNQGATSNVATITVNVPASVDLAISTVGPAYFKPGDTLSYTLTVTNSGSAATGVTVSDTLPAGLTFASASSGGTYSAVTGKVSWTVGTVASGAAVTLTLSGTAPLAASVETNNGPTTLVNTATVQGNETEVVTANNAASATSQLIYPKLSKRVRNVTQSGAFGVVGTGRPGEVLEYCIDFKNYGVAVANFVISDSVPSNTNAALSAYGAGLGLQVLRNNATTTRTSTNSDADGGSLSASAVSLTLGTLAAGENGSGCFQSTIK